MTSLLEVDDLHVRYETGGQPTSALDGATLSLQPGETVGVVGESGSGKSTLGSVIGRLLPPSAKCVQGSIRIDGVDVLALDTRGMRELRREVLGFVPQDPVGALDPTMRIGRQLKLALGDGSGLLTDLLEQVQIADPQRVLRLYPHQISGGMAQRIAIAMAMARKPRLLIADEPTAALDAQVRAEVLRLMFDLAASSGTAIIWLSHDLNAVARWCDRVAVMYGGRVVEDGGSTAVLEAPAHPYTAALSAANPADVVAGDRLVAIGGAPPVLHGSAEGCAFAPRCPLAIDACTTARPTVVDLGDRTVLCELVGKQHPAAPPPEIETIREAAR
jgi:oligopeptide/dipeptide ABC transporter ATP-binding protein